MGPVNPACAVRFAETGSYHSAWGSLVLVGSGHRARSGRLVPPAGAKTQGVPGLNRVWDGISGGRCMWKLMSKYAYVGRFRIFPGIEIDSNSWAHQVWVCLISLPCNVVITWICLLQYMVLLSSACSHLIIMNCFTFQLFIFMIYLLDDLCHVTWLKLKTKDSQY